MSPVDNDAYIGEAIWVNWGASEFDARKDF